MKSRPGGPHTALLDDACGDDLAMRAEVKALLAADSKVGRFGETSLFASNDQQAHFEPDTRFGHYRIANRTVDTAECKIKNAKCKSRFSILHF